MQAPGATASAESTVFDARARDFLEISLRCAGNLSFDQKEKRARQAKWCSSDDYAAHHFDPKQQRSRWA